MSDKKHKRLAITLDTKIQVLNRLAKGEGSTSVGKQFGLNESTVRAIKKNESAIRNSVVTGTKLNAKSSSYTRDIIKVKMENALILWLENCSQKKIPVNGISIKQKALTIYKELKKNESSQRLNKKYDFPASNGWLMGFLRRYSLHNAKIKDIPVTKRKQVQLATIIADDTDELLVDEPLEDNEITEVVCAPSHLLEENNEDEKKTPISANLIEKGLQLACELESHFFTHDTVAERVTQFRHELASCMAHYQELYSELTSSTESSDNFEKDAT